jgi:hypothetical protein
VGGLAIVWLLRELRSKDRLQEARAAVDAA